MNSDILWQAFVDTGDPAYYVLYKSATGKEKKEKEKKDGGTGQMPAASD